MSSQTRARMVAACLLGCVLCGGGEASPTPGPGAAGDELLLQPRLLGTHTRALGEAWREWRPEWSASQVSIRATSKGLEFSSRDRPFAVGGVSQKVAGIKAGQAYAVSATCELRAVPQPESSVLVRLEFLKDGEPLHPAGMLARGPQTSGKEARFADVLVAPAGADGARVSLEVMWPRGGTVLWKEASLRAVATPPPRKVKVGTVYLRPRDTTPARDLDLWCDQVDAAGKLGLDIVCLSEAITSVGTQARTSDLAEPVPGPTTRRLGEAARRNHLWVVAGVTERDGTRLLNTAVLLDREGRLAGRYRKVHLPREEWRKGITPGSEFPVFQTEFGTIGIQICYDYFFPETAEILALRGAEIVFAPTWGTTFADQEGRVEGRNIFRVRARDNGVYLVASVYDGDSLVVDPLGRVLASSDGRTGVFWSEIDLNAREPLWWVGHWRTLGPRHRRPETYQPWLTSPGARP